LGRQEIAGQAVFTALAAWAFVAFPAVALSAAPELFLGEEPESYVVIDKLEGMGLLPDLMTGDRPVEAREVAREAKKAGSTDDPFTDGMLRFLGMGDDLRFDFRLRAGGGYSGEPEVPPNAQGFPVPKGGWVRAGGFFRSSPAHWLAVQARGDGLWDFGDETIGRLGETSARVGWPQATLEAGRFSLWWGPGRHGALLFTTNAQPLTGVRFRNPRPIALGWPLRFLGLFQYDFFIARLEGSRPIPHTLLSGIRLALRPGRHVEVGVSRAVHYGGSGRGNGLRDWWDAFKGGSANDPGTTGNQLGGADISITLPFRVQPVRLYGEAAGEDQARGHIVPLPSKWAYLAGIFLPSVLGSARWDLRAEAAANHVRGNGPAWYVHSRPEYAHRYRGQILGHPMGTDARDLFLEARYFMLPSSYIEVNLDRTERMSPGPAKEKATRVGAGLIAWLTKNWRAEARVAIYRVSNQGGTPGKDSSDVPTQFNLSYQYR